MYQMKFMYAGDRQWLLYFCGSPRERGRRFERISRPCGSVVNLFPAMKGKIEVDVELYCKEDGDTRPKGSMVLSGAVKTKMVEKELYTSKFSAATTFRVEERSISMKLNGKELTASQLVFFKNAISNMWSNHDPIRDLNDFEWYLVFKPVK